MLKRLAVALVVIVGFFAGFGVKSVIPNSPARPTPEQYLESLVKAHLSWVERHGGQIAYDHAKGLEFVVTPKRIEVVVNFVEAEKAQHPEWTVNAAIGAAAAFVARYAGFNASSQAMFDFESLVSALNNYGPILWLTYGDVVGYKIGTFQSRAVSVAITADQATGAIGTAIFSVGAVAR